MKVEDLKGKEFWYMGMFTANNLIAETFAYNLNEYHKTCPLDNLKKQINSLININKHKILFIVVRIDNEEDCHILEDWETLLEDEKGNEIKFITDKVYEILDYLDELKDIKEI